MASRSPPPAFGHGPSSSFSSRPTSLSSASTFPGQGYMSSSLSSFPSPATPQDGNGNTSRIAGISGKRRRGVCKFFNSQKGFGFVNDNRPEELGGQEVFVHYTAISAKSGFRSLAEGEEVEYEIVQGPKGFQASEVSGPGGQTVVGDPKARLQKAPPYMPFAPIAMAPYAMGGDPYASGNAMYGGSPYTQHILYVPQHPGVGGPFSPNSMGNGRENFGASRGPTGLGGEMGGHRDHMSAFMPISPAGMNGGNHYGGGGNSGMDNFWGDNTFGRRDNGH